MAFSYVGNFPNQQVSNSGVLSLDDINNLESTGELGGSLELIASTTVSSAGAVEFTSIKETKYSVHYLTYQGMSMGSVAGVQIPYYRVSNDGGSTYESSNYASTGQFNTAGGTTVKLTNQSTYGHLCGNQQGNYKWNGHAYFYNLGNSSKYSFVTYQAVGHYSADSQPSSTFGNSVYKVAETINALQFKVESNVDIDEGTIKLYGVKQL